MERGVAPSLCTLEDSFILVEDFEATRPKSRDFEVKKAEALVESGLLVRKWVQKNYPDGTKIRTFPDGSKFRVEPDETLTPL
jgi:hypothetical protein